MFITFEGIEGSGKSTQLKMLNEYLVKQGREVIAVREPGSTKVGEKIREILLNSSEGAAMEPFTELLLYEAARAEILGKIIKPALMERKIVLCDRFADSTIAYQCYGRGIAYDRVEAMNAAVTRGIKPDMTFLIDCTVEEGLKRAFKRIEGTTGSKEDRFEKEDVRFHERVKNGFHWLSRLERRIYLVDGMRNAEAVHVDIVKVVDKLL